MPSFKVTVLYACVVVALIFALKFAHGKMQKKTEYFAVSACEATDKPYTLIFFYMDGCGHCRDFRPTWQDFTDHASDEKKKVCFAEMSSENDAVMNAYNITGFPTVLLVNNAKNTTKTFNGPRTVDGLRAFVRDSAK
jgi:thioredoxin-like negative regulator of GroEL